MSKSGDAVTQADIVGYIKKNPGKTTTEIGKRFGMGQGRMFSRLATLRRMGKAYSRKSTGNSSAWFFGRDPDLMKAMESDRGPFAIATRREYRGYSNWGKS